MSTNNPMASKCNYCGHRLTISAAGTDVKHRCQKEQSGSTSRLGSDSQKAAKGKNQGRYSSTTDYFRSITDGQGPHNSWPDPPRWDDQAKLGTHPYSCRQCDSHFSSEEELLSHHNAVHLGRQSLRCANCLTEFENDDQIMQHQCPGNLTMAQCTGSSNLNLLD